MTRIEMDDACCNVPADRWSDLRVQATFFAPEFQFMGPGDASVR